MHVVEASLVASIIAVVFGACNASADTSERRLLPAATRTGGASLADVLASRRSIRSFRTDPIADEHLGQLLWAAQGTSDGHRTAPSAGALYPLTIYAVDARGVWRYAPADHALSRITETDQRERIAKATYGQDAVSGAPIVFVITADFSVTARKYGSRAERYATLEAGHAAQNMLLTATALGLGAVPIGAFDDSAIKRALRESATPLYVIPVGRPH